MHSRGHNECTRNQHWFTSQLVDPENGGNSRQEDPSNEVDLSSGLILCERYLQDTNYTSGKKVERSALQAEILEDAGSIVKNSIDSG